MVTKKPKGLGRGLEALLGPQVGADSDSAGSAPQPSAVKLDQLRPGKYQPRTRMDEGALVLALADPRRFFARLEQGDRLGADTFAHLAHLLGDVEVQVLTTLQKKLA